jgi:hypothetical protein
MFELDAVVKASAPKTFQNTSGQPDSNVRDAAGRKTKHEGLAGEVS